MKSQNVKVNDWKRLYISTSLETLNPILEVLFTLVLGKIYLYKYLYWRDCICIIYIKGDILWPYSIFLEEIVNVFFILPHLEFFLVW